MSNGHACCVLAVCCPPGSAEQLDALVSEIQKQHPDMKGEKAKAAAKRILKEHGNFRTVPKILREYTEFTA